MRDDRSVSKPHEGHSEPEKKEQSLKGAFASVMILGAFLAITWIGVFILFVARD
ncbi:cytochrome c oxidase subunit IIa family protein [Cohnella sp. SGD-V74]|jgi:cell division septal protein FtsQ|uniref:cytochrome c oxidase subunit 2A n=1 Tax=unclassified Cohnella TaxID=2636738 RepID=UPI000D074EDE|nr:MULTISPECIES: cytochrome c oxidase subunit 2A [unclassified Cohnella]PRX60981.1 cytochrome c oxidase subunit IIa family protein [Cohnella sp. SGD-V74]